MSESTPLTLRTDSVATISSKMIAITCLLIAFFNSETSHLVGANSNSMKTTNNQLQAQNTYLQRPDPSGRPQLMVAIYCGGESSTALYHNQYLDIESRKWRTDRDVRAFCTQDKQAILDYCRKVYPSHDIRNIVESSRPYKIENWCKLGSSKRRCRARLAVRPYRCLEGTFQSDALLVPERCVFDHVHNKSICETPDAWNRTAAESCSSKNSMRLQSFGMLQPCGLDVFSGVEFVCCPTAASEQSHQTSGLEGNSFAQAANAMVTWPKATDAEEKFNNIKTDEDPSPNGPKKHQSDQQNGSNSEENDENDEDEDGEDEDEYDDDSTVWNNNDDKSSTTSTTTSTTTTTTTTTERPIDHYLSHFDLTHEHDDFKKAELAVENNYRDKITHVMREWSQLDGRYEEMKKTNPQAAEEFKKKMTHQFQKTIEALEEEGAAQRHQLASMHAERAMAIINRRKKSAMDCLTQALDLMPIRTRQVERCIVKLLKALEKDRAHTLRQYKNLLNLNTREALHEKKIILDHLITLNRAANQSIAMLDRSPILVDKLKSKIITLWHRLRNIPVNEPILRESELKIMEKYEEEVAQKKIERERKLLAEKEMAQSRESMAEKSEQQAQKIKADEQVSTVASSPNENKKQIESVAVAPPRSENLVVNQTTQLDGQTDPALPTASSSHENYEVSNTEQQTHYQIDSAKFSHLNAETPYHELSYTVRHDPLIDRSKIGYTTFLGLTCAAVVVLAFIGVKLYGKNSSRAYKRQGFAEVGRSCPEEKNVTNMQFNGYENPAYKFFEAADA